ncbi:Mur ligase family protein [Ningiella sp. W23]|uniref:Mur ligase family protein n=1 Tax=Ningiella sp. W23 TaxID=3023715 RepID=UPI003756ECF8
MGMDKREASYNLSAIRFSQENLSAALLLLVDQARLAGMSKCVKHVNDISLNSRQASKSTAFIALKGAVGDGYDYIEDALKNGCSLILCEKPVSSSVLSQCIDSKGKRVCAVLVKSDLKQLLPDLLQQLYPQKTSLSNRICAVTGTNGKTSVASFYAQLGLALHEKNASLGTLGLNILARSESFSNDEKQDAQHRQDHIEDSNNTTPDIITHHKVLALLQTHDVGSYCLEASSHGLEQGRLQGLNINTAIFTNLSQDHLDYHQSMAAYGAAKRRLLNFDTLQHLILNADDPQSKVWQTHARPSLKCLWYATDKTNIPADAEFYCVANDISCTKDGLQFTLESTWGSTRINLALLGRFNVANYLAALSAHLIESVQKSLPTASDDGASHFAALVKQSQRLSGVAGRMELFVGAKSRGNFIVDYAHTPDALAQALKASRAHTSGTLFCVFGCGGNRDKAKRKLMGEVAAQYSDSITLTEDNNRDESVESIIADIKQGIDEQMQMHNTSLSVHIEHDRKTAIVWTYEQSTPNDLILLAGKGHENYIEKQGERIHYSERKFAMSLCANTPKSLSGAIA